MTRGVRMIDGQEYLLSGRGTKAEAQAEAARLRGREWAKVRVIPWPPMGTLTNDYGIWCHARLPRPLTEKQVWDMFAATDEVQANKQHRITVSDTANDR